MRQGGDRGSLELRGDTWWWRTRVEHVDPATGEISHRRPRIALGSTTELRTRAAARRAAYEWAARGSTETLVAGPTISAPRYFEKFLTTEAVLWRRTSRRHYTSIVRAHLVKAFPGPLSGMDVASIKAFVARLVARGLSRHTVRNVRAVLLHILRQAALDEFQVRKIDSRLVRIPKETRVARERRWITSDELDTIIAAAEWPWRALWAVMGQMGLRIGEGLGLEWSHVDLEARVIRIGQAAILGELAPTKTSTSKADLPMPATLGAILAEYRAAWTPNALDLLFANRNGQPLRADDVRRHRLQPLLARLALPPAGTHAFRHGAPRRLLAAGVSPAVVSKLMRHASLRMTETYTHTTAEDLRAAVEAGAQRLKVARDQQTITPEPQHAPT